MLKPRLRICARPHCGTEFKTSSQTRKYCSPGCTSWGKRQNQQNRRKPLRSSQFTVETGPPLTEGLTSYPTCGCGRRLVGGTDFLGRTTLDCEHCEISLPVKIIGEHKYDQFERHLVELSQLISRGKTQVSRKVSKECGDAFRQDTHKRGIIIRVFGQAMTRKLRGVA